MCVECVCGVCAESVWDVRFVFWYCGVLCCVVMCGVSAGVGVQCVCAVWCVVSVVSVRGVCLSVCVPVRFDPCCTGKRSRVYFENAPVCTFKTSVSHKTRAF